MWNDTQRRPRWYSPLPWLPPPPDSEMIAGTMLMFPEIQNCNEGKRICPSFSLCCSEFFVFTTFCRISSSTFFGVFSFFHLVSKDREFNLFLVHVLRYVAASVPRVLNSYLMTRQRWRDRGEEGVSVTPSPRYSSGCQIIFSQTFNFPILATTRAIHWKLPGHGHYRPGPRKWSRTETDAINILAPYPDIPANSGRVSWISFRWRLLHTCYHCSLLSYSGRDGIINSCPD